MVNLDKDTINVIQKLEKAVENTGFEINRFKVSDTALEDRQIIELDIRRIVIKDAPMEDSE